MENKKPDIDVCFLLNKNSVDWVALKNVGKLISFPSTKQKLLYLLSDCNISSHADHASMGPFHGYNQGYRDIQCEKRLVFLQHGIIQSDFASWLARSKNNLFGFVTSAQAEYDSIIQGQYGYSENEIWLTGMPRFDRLPAEGQKEKIITIAPTWRQYLMGSASGKSGERGLKSTFYQSEYYLFYNRLLNHTRLLEAAEKHGYQLALFPHPNMQGKTAAFHQDSRVRICGKETSYREMYEKSCLMVTDYSSMVFDFAYMGRPVIYTQFDRDRFFGGGHTSKAGYFDYDRDGFGEVEYDLESTVDRIIEYMERNCMMKEKYKERANSFFAYRDRNNCQRVYDKIVSACNTK